MEDIMKSLKDSCFQNIKVLYVEDDPFSRDKLLHILERRFAKVLVAIDGDEGYMLFQKHQPDLVIADIKMNQMNGLEMIEKIRQQTWNTQIIVTTAYEDSEYLLQSIENNVNHFILKPIDLGKLYDAIQKSIYHVQLEKELERQKKLSRVMMDFQDHLIFLADNKFIIDGNRAFTSFTGIDKFANRAVKDISNLFVEDENYFYPLNADHWTEEFLTDHNSSAKVKWYGKKGKEAIFLMKATKIPEEKLYLYVCTDITDLEIEKKSHELFSSLDPLTKIYNRNKFDDILASEMKRTERYHHRFSVILFGIDNFKQINKRFGNQIGDEVLVTMSTIVQQRIRETDIFARWGNEEFFLITPEDDINGAAILAESIRVLIGGFYFPNIGNLTCSFGVAEFSSGKSKQQLLKEAGKALQHSKNKGRNCVTIYEKQDKEGVSGA